MIEPGSYKCNYSDIYRIAYGVSEKRDLKTGSREPVVTAK